ncbi:MAG: hypothetical protein IJV43_02665 [Oscillospiraceae bacterium]|nr:hypothetical protein [Oscillospiraceae bacterium]
MKKAFTIYLLALCLTLSGCGDRLLERSYSSVTPHSAVFRETEDADTLRAENYQDLVNALLILLGEHSEGGVVRIYGDAPNKAELAENACVEVQKETPVGAYLLDYITYDGKAESGYYELTARFGYRRTAEEQAAIVNATSTEALPDLLRAAIDEGRDAAAIRVGYFGTDRNGVLEMVRAVHDEVYPPEELTEDGELPAEQEGAENEPPELAGLPPETEPTPAEDAPPDLPAEPDGPMYDIAPWEVLFYPDNAQPGIVEVVLYRE